jgi:hypothetical protein
MVNERGQSDQLLIFRKPFDNIEVRQLTFTPTKKWNLARQSRRRTNELTDRANSNRNVVT